MNRKIYFIRANRTKFGGAENYLSRLSDALKKRNVEHELIHSHFPKFLPAWLRVLLFNFYVCRVKKGRFYFSLERITCPDVYRAGDGVHKAFLETKRFSLNPLNPVYLYIEKRCFRNAQLIIANSELVKEQIVGYYGIDAHKITVIYNGIVLKSFNAEEARQKLTKAFGIAEDKKIILFVGSGFARKGVEEFLNIVAQLKHRDLYAFVVGKEKKMGRYKSLAAKLGLLERVFFTGPREDVDLFYAASDIFLFPTRYEPFSNVVLEAMSFHNAVFTTRQNGAHEILDDAFVMQSPADPEVVAKIDALLEDTPRLEVIKRQNLERVKAFTIEKNLEATLQALGEADSSFSF